MPISCTSCIPFIAQDLYCRRPNSVLDLGIGYGLYGAMVRNYCGDFDPLGNRSTILIGIEGFRGYRNPLWDLYDLVNVTTIPTYLVNERDTFDVILLMDVVEHFDKPEGLRILEACKKRLTPGGILWVGTPAVWTEQGATHGNKLETHHCLWTADELRDLGFLLRLDGSPDAIGNQMLLGSYSV